MNNKLTALSCIIACLPLAVNATTEADVNEKHDAISSEQSTIFGTNTQVDYKLKQLGDKQVGIYEGDIILGEQADIQDFGVPSFVIGKYKDFSGKASFSGKTTWPNGVVPYIFNSAVPSNDRTTILNAMKWIEKVANITFVERTNEAGYIDIVRKDGCYSYVGRTGTRQPVSIGRGCGHTGIVAHEFLHALGFYHEQSRADRDQHVNIHWQNIRSGMDSNFRKQGSVTTSVGPYDVKSIMHYGYKAFSTNGQPTITSKDASIPHSALGQRSKLTALDIAALQKVYGKPKGGTKPTPPPVSNNKLTNGKTISVSGNKSEAVYFTIDVPTNTTLSVKTRGGSGDADLYVKRGSKPTTGSFDCRPYKNGNSESCSIVANASTYHVMLKGYSNFANVSLTASYQAGSVSNKAPVAAFTATVSKLKAQFSNQSTDSDGTIASYNWKFGDNTSSTSKAPSHTYAQSGSYQVKLTVTDNKGASKSITKSVTVKKSSTTPTPPPTGSCDAQWESGKVYNTGDTASHGGKVYQANWWNKGQSPAGNSGQWKVWSEVSSC
ncbi:MAG: PKD domain-containing protein [Alteromonadales bacterium]|nr:PKD domain-containing protein [Alteromonadales bacterium]